MEKEKIPQLIQLLDELEALLLKGWCKRRYAADAKGMTVDVDSPIAAKFCLVGGQIRASKMYPDLTNHLYAEIQVAILPRTQISYNDACETVHQALVPVRETRERLRRQLAT